MPPCRPRSPRLETSTKDEPSLRELLQRVTEPEPPIGQLVGTSLRAGVRLRRRRLGLSTAVAGAAVVAIGVVTATLTSPAGHPSVTVRVSAEPVAGPSADQLARGRWVRMPPAPIQMCGPLAFWDGRGLVAIQEPASPCPLRAAEYNPRVNRWTRITAPPIFKHEWAVAASGGGRAVLVVNTGATYSWQQASGRWQPHGKLPAGSNRFSITWTGSTFLVTSSTTGT